MKENFSKDSSESRKLQSGSAINRRTFLKGVGATGLSMGAGIAGEAIGSMFTPAAADWPQGPIEPRQFRLQEEAAMDHWRSKAENMTRAELDKKIDELEDALLLEIQYWRGLAAEAEERGGTESDITLGNRMANWIGQVRLDDKPSVRATRGFLGNIIGRYEVRIKVSKEIWGERKRAPPPERLR